MLKPDAQAAAAPLQRRLEFEWLLAELSARFINLPAVEIDDAITDALRRIVELLDVDRSTLIRFPPESSRADVTHSWGVAGMSASLPSRDRARTPRRASRRARRRWSG